MSDNTPIRRALISVSDKAGILELGQGLRRDAAHLAVEPGCFLGDEVLDECGDVLMSVAQPR